MTQRCSLTEHEQQQRIIELIIASTPIADFQKELLRKDKTLTLEETVSIGKTYEASNIHIKQLRTMVNNNNVDNTNIQAIRTPTRSTRSNKCLKCGKSHAFHREACPASKCNTCGKANITTIKVLKKHIFYILGGKSCRYREYDQEFFNMPGRPFGTTKGNFTVTWHP